MAFLHDGLVLLLGVPRIVRRVIVRIALVPQQSLRARAAALFRLTDNPSTRLVVVVVVVVHLDRGARAAARETFASLVDLLEVLVMTLALLLPLVFRIPLVRSRGAHAVGPRVLHQMAAHLRQPAHRRRGLQRALVQILHLFPVVVRSHDLVAVAQVHVRQTLAMRVLQRQPHVLFLLLLSRELFLVANVFDLVDGQGWTR